MSIELDPIVGCWYERADKGQKFEVVGVDEHKAVVEIQHFDGDLEEIDLEEWYDLEIEPIETPEDWSGPIDDVETDDLGYTETEMEPEDWSESLSEITVPEVVGGAVADEEDQEEARDEWGDTRMIEERWEGEA